MGDFYELFFDDAVKAAAALDIALTRRGKHEGEDIPMAGVPVHSHEGYVARLIRAGFKVAVCEQTEDPAEAKKRGGKAVVARDVVRVITAGTLTEDTLLDARRPNYLAALAEGARRVGRRLDRHLDRRAADAVSGLASISPRRWRGSSRASCCWRTGCCSANRSPDGAAEWRERPDAAAGRAASTRLSGRRRLQAVFGVAGPRRRSARSRRPKWRRWAHSSTMSS